MKNPDQLVVFTLDENRYALHLSAVERVVRMVEITPLPKAPGIVPGVVNLQGRVIPVINMRRRFHLPEREIELGDQLVIAHTPRRSVAVAADSVSSVVEYSKEKVVEAGKILPGMEYVEGVVKLEDGMILIHDLDTFLSLEEEKMLDNALKKSGGENDREHSRHHAFAPE
ncbi:MAG: chemotaxis protein CheW [ANME-2 cluster archaeon]|nr:chemotaxis protein CheW [ANME-2 cluster archaeon]